MATPDLVRAAAAAILRVLKGSKTLPAAIQAGSVAKEAALFNAAVDAAVGAGVNRQQAARTLRSVLAQEFKAPPKVANSAQVATGSVNELRVKGTVAKRSPVLDQPLVSAREVRPEGEGKIRRSSRKVQTPAEADYDLMDRMDESRKGVKTVINPDKAPDLTRFRGITGKASTAQAAENAMNRLAVAHRADPQGSMPLIQETVRRHYPNPQDRVAAIKGIVSRSAQIPPEVAAEQGDLARAYLLGMNNPQQAQKLMGAFTPEIDGALKEGMQLSQAGLDAAYMPPPGSGVRYVKPSLVKKPREFNLGEVQDTQPTGMTTGDLQPATWARATTDPMSPPRYPVTTYTTEKPELGLVPGNVVSRETVEPSGVGEFQAGAGYTPPRKIARIMGDDGNPISVVQTERGWVPVGVEDRGATAGGKVRAPRGSVVTPRATGEARIGLERDLGEVPEFYPSADEARAALESRRAQAQAAAVRQDYEELPGGDMLDIFGASVSGPAANAPMVRSAGTDPKGFRYAGNSSVVGVPLATGEPSRLLPGMRYERPMSRIPPTATLEGPVAPDPLAGGVSAPGVGGRIQRGGQAEIFQPRQTTIHGGMEDYGPEGFVRGGEILPEFVSGPGGRVEDFLAQLEALQVGGPVMEPVPQVPGQLSFLPRRAAGRR